MSDAFVNEVTANLPAYPMESLTKIKLQLIADSKKVYDFGTGDPKIETWEPIRNALIEGVSKISQYPSIRGCKELEDAQRSYLKRRFGVDDPKLCVLPTKGSKEAVFHIMLSLAQRNGKNTLIYPDPGYPVYRSSALYSGAVPYPVTLDPKNGFLLEPWTLPKDVQRSATAIWVNYPHNPTGACAPRSYFERLVEWCHQQDVILLSDDCYIDIYDHERIAEPPTCPLELSSDRVISFFSLSKRSGMTGYRSGFIAGDARILEPHAKARANFGLGVPDFIQKASIVAWSDDQHVQERCRIFSERLTVAGKSMHDLGLLQESPCATFYLWCPVPKEFAGDDIRFCLELAQKGMITVPSQWLSEGIRGWFRLAMVPSIEDTYVALNILKDFIGTSAK